MRKPSLLLPVCLLLIGVRYAIIGFLGSPTPYADQWDGEAAAYYKPYIEHTLQVSSLFDMDNEHRFFWTRLFDLALLELGGRWDPIFQMLANVLIHVSALMLVIYSLSVASIVGSWNRTFFILSAAAFFAVPFGTENLLLGFNTHFYLLILLSVSALALGLSSPPFSPPWWGAVACGIAAYFTLISGALSLLPVATVAAVEIAQRRRRGAREVAAVWFLLLIVATMLYTVKLSLAGRVGETRPLADMLRAWLQAVGWPVTRVLGNAEMLSANGAASLALALVVNTPVMAVAWRFVTKPAARNLSFVIALGLWSALQCAAFAYGRPGIFTRRYVDIYTIGLVVNLACLMLLAGDAGGAWARQLRIGYLCIVAVFGIVAMVRVANDLQRYSAELKLATANLIALLRDGDPDALLHKTTPYIYPDPARLVGLASDPTIRSILADDLLSADVARKTADLRLHGPLRPLMLVLDKFAGMIGAILALAGAAGIALFVRDNSGSKKLPALPT